LATKVEPDAQISGFGPLVDERKRIEEELEAGARGGSCFWTPPGPTTQPYGPLRCSR
jgi:hypothetical protein